MQLDRLFQPFQRFKPQPTSDGHGLEPSIVQAIATAHEARTNTAASASPRRRAQEIPEPIHTHAHNMASRP